MSISDNFACFNDKNEGINTPTIIIIFYYILFGMRDVGHYTRKFSDRFQI